MIELQRIWNSAPVAVLDPDRRHALILLAQTRDEDAVLDLLGHYVGALRGAIRRFGLPDDADLRQLALLSLLVAVDRYDPADQYAELPRLISTLLDACWTAVAGDQAVPVEGRTMRRFRAAVRRANGNQYRAEEIAVRYGIPRDTFRVIAANSRPAPLAEVDRTIDLFQTDTGDLARRALASLPPRDRRIVEYRFGFVDGHPHSDDETAEALRSSRATVQRRVRAALITMRAALALAEAA